MAAIVDERDGAVEGNLEMAYSRLLALATDVEALRSHERRRFHAVSSRCSVCERVRSRIEPAYMIDYLMFRSMVRARAQRMNMAMTPIRHDAPGGPVGGGDMSCLYLSWRLLERFNTS